MPDQTTSQALPLEFRVLEGELSRQVLQDGQPAGIVRLVGRALPTTPLKFEGKQRHKTTFYAGNPTATQQVIGPTEEPTVIGGKWQDRYLGDGAARQLARLFEDIRRRGPLLEMSWGASLLDQEDGAVGVVGSLFTRRGLLTNASFTFRIPTACEWELEFTWRGQDELTSAPIAATGVLAPKEGLLGVAQDLDDAQSMLEAFRQFQASRVFGMPAQVLSRMDQSVSQVEAAVEALQAGGTAATGLMTVPAGVADRLTATLALGARSMADMTTALLSLPLGRLVPADNALELLQARQNILDMLGQQSRAQEACAVAAANLDRQADPDLLATVDLPAGTDLREVALRYYGDPDGWIDIANHPDNDLPTSEVPGATGGPSVRPYRSIRIPRRQQGAGNSTIVGC